MSLPDTEALSPLELLPTSLEVSSSEASVDKSTSERESDHNLRGCGSIRPVLPNRIDGGNELERLGKVMESSTTSKNVFLTQTSRLCGMATDEDMIEYGNMKGLGFGIWN